MLKDLLSAKKSAITKRWVKLILETYPAETRKFLKTQNDQFANPVGQTILKEIDAIFNKLLDDPDFLNVIELSSFLDNIIRIRAVQSMSASEGVGFVFKLKDALREELAKDIEQPNLARELLAFESKIDKLALMSFDIYMGCREQIYDIKAKELRNRSASLLDMITKKYGYQQPESDPEEGEG